MYRFLVLESGGRFRYVMRSGHQFGWESTTFWRETVECCVMFSQQIH